MHGQITEDWADGTYTFRIGYGQWLELDQELKIGPLALYKQFLMGDWRARDIREVMRLALIGGGAEPVKALRLVKTYVEDRPLLESLPFVLRILEAAISIPEGAKQPGEAEAATEMAGSTSAPPMETLQ